MKRIPLLAALLLAATAQAAEFRSSDIHPDDYPTVQAVRFMGQELARLSGGKNTIKLYARGVLGSEKDTLEQTKIGALAMTRVSLPQMNNICASTVIPTLPFLFRSTAHLRAVLDGPVGEALLKDCEAQGFVGLAFYDAGSRSIYTVKKPIKTLADVKGLKIRVQQSDLWVSMMTALGANPTPMPYGEVYTALRTGLVDAAENNIPSFESTRQFEVAKFYNRTEHSMAPELLLFSKRVWDKLTPAEQGQIRAAAKASVPLMRKLWDEREATSLATVKAGGVQIVEVERGAFEAAVKPVYEQFLKEPRLLAWVKQIQETK
jgi:tripartite ATP-independent transporter DctP family solute receptor